MRRFLVITVCLTGLLCGCASVGDELRARLQTYNGQNIQAVIDRIGYPTSQQKILGDTVYTWNANVGAVDFDWGRVNLVCTIQIATDEGGRIKSFHASGTNGGCQRFDDALGR